VSTDLTTQSEVFKALQAQQEAEFEGDTFQTPILKLCQPLTREVGDDLAEPGDFFNTLTSESYGNAIEFVVAYYNKGRSASVKGGRYFVGPHEIIPESWKDHPDIGEAWVGQPFADHPEAEEQYKRRVNAGEIEWGSGPKISTTYNYTGLVLVPQVEGDDSEQEIAPVRFSLQRTGKKAADKINTILRAVLRNKNNWDKVLQFDSVKRDFGSNKAYVVNVKLGRDTTADEREQAAELALAFMSGNVVSDEEAAESGPTVAPDSRGGLDV